MEPATIRQHPLQARGGSVEAPLLTSHADIPVRLTGWLRQALEDFRECDGALLDVDASEWACVFRLGVCLTRYVDRGWNVDSEYNRQGLNGDPKRLSVPKRTGGGREVPPRRGLTVRPDIAIHHRGRPELAHNLLYLEVKKEWTGNGNKHDLRKVRPAVRGNAERTGKQAFQYQFGAVLGLCVNGTSKSCFNPTWRLFSSSGKFMDQGERLLPSGSASPRRDRITLIPRALG